MKTTLTPDQIGAEKWLELNAQLQEKKREVICKMVSTRTKGDHPEYSVEKTGKNAAQHYEYISEADYKKAFQNLLSASLLSLSSDVDKLETYSIPKFDRNGNKVGENTITRVYETFTLTDTQTGFYESVQAIGDGFDTLDKGIYKARTGALKYFLANNFLVVGGDEPEKDGPMNSPRNPQQQPQNQGNRQAHNQQQQRPAAIKRPTEQMLRRLQELYPTEIDAIKQGFRVSNIGDIPYNEVLGMIQRREAEMGLNQV